MLNGFDLDEPIIKSLLDLDFYKLTMGQLILEHHPQVLVTFALKNRTQGINLCKEIDLQELREQLDYVIAMKLHTHELNYLKCLSLYGQAWLFSERYLNFLKQLSLCEYELKQTDNDLVIKVKGPWSVVTYWETIILAIVNELRSRQWLGRLSEDKKNTVFSESMKKLDAKVRFLKEHPEISFIEFGTRRRFMSQWQDLVVGCLKAELPESQLLGTSNVFLAQKHELVPGGTNAHELPMVYSAIYAQDDLEKGWLWSQRKMLVDWYAMYGQPLSIMLSDTYSTKYFLEHIVTPDMARDWKGSRQDSGDPIAYGEMWIEYYKRYGINPRDKVIIFSDGLNIQTMHNIATHLAGRIKVLFGWGTNLTNDIGLKPLSLVMKTVSAKIGGLEIPLVKLSDNIEKATGDPEAIKKMKEQIGYEVRFSESCVY